MSEQLALPGMADPSAPPYDLFFALQPDEDARIEITKLGQDFIRSHGFRGKLVDEARYHVTTLFVGDSRAFSESAIQNMVQAASAAALSTEMFRMEFDHIGGFGSRGRLSPLVLNHHQENPFFFDLAHRLHTELLRRGVRAQKNPSSKLHLTLCYREQFVEATPVAPVGWQVKELVLIKSLLGKGQHIQLGKWPLQTAV